MLHYFGKHRNNFINLRFRREEEMKNNYIYVLNAFNVDNKQLK